jgi:hypothetical protein
MRTTFASIQCGSADDPSNKRHRVSRLRIASLYRLVPDRKLHLTTGPPQAARR